MRQATTIVEFETWRQGLVEITSEVSAWVGDQQLTTGLLTLFCQHTSASLLIQENAAPEVRSDLEAYFARIAPEDANVYAHDDEGLDDMPAHLRTALTQVQLSIPLIMGGWHWAPGRASISSSTADARTIARSRCISLENKRVTIPCERLSK